MSEKAAFPLLYDDGGFQSGMTLRDYFAAKAMQGWHANPDNVPTPEGWVAKWAYDEADAMLKARGNA